MGYIYRLIRSIISNPIGKIDVAMISNYRDYEDVKYFGFSNIKDVPDVLPWVEYVWENKQGRLFMIGSTTEDCANNPQKANQQFLRAVEIAIACGAKVILFAAATKRLGIIDVLRKRYPNVIFTIGDNFTILLLKQGVQRLIDRTGVVSRVLVIAPHGFLGGEVSEYLLERNYEVAGLINSESINKLQRKMKIQLFNSFENVGKVDMVVACGNAPYYQLTPERIEMVRRLKKKLLVVDPCEPSNMIFKSDKAIRVDAGNGYSSNLKYVFEPLSYKILRLKKGVIWGCFCEALIIARHREQLKNIDWFKINNQNQSILERIGGFGLPNETCFNKEIRNWSLEVN